MSNFFGKIIPRDDGKIKVVTVLENGEETVDWCSLDEIQEAISEKPPRIRSLADLASELPARDMEKEANGYWVAFEFNSGMIGTWSAYASNADSFIKDLLESEKGTRIKRFTELHIEDRKSVTILPPEKISVAKYNRLLARTRRKNQ